MNSLRSALTGWPAWRTETYIGAKPYPRQDHLITTALHRQRLNLSRIRGLLFNQR